MNSVVHSLALLAALMLSPNLQAQDGAGHVTNHQTTSPTAMSAKQAATQDALRDLWVEHVFWIRNYVVATATDNNAAKKVAVEQVVANATAISAAVGSFYGEQAGKQMLNLLGGHWSAVKDYSDATFTTNAQGQQKAAERLTSNAKQIAAFLAGANPYLPEDALIGLLSAHGAHHIAQVQQLSTGNYVAEAKTWSAMRLHMFTIGDALADGLAKQFPDRF
jgi:hypothetical protein